MSGKDDEAPDSGEDAWDGDAPMAAPLDAPSNPRTNDLRAIFSQESSWKDVTASLPAPSPLPPMRARVSEPPRPRPSEPPPPPLDPRADTPPPQRTDPEVPIFVERSGGGSTFGAPPVFVEPRPPRSPSTTSRRPMPREPSRSRLLGAPQKPVRDYPVLRSLVDDPGRFLPVHSGEDKALAPSKAPVRPPRREEPASRKVDGLLEEMAEGLFVGGDGQQNEMRVTLGEDFFGGTELRISRGPDGVTAVLLPPDRDSYRLLSSELPRLRAQLEQRGLRVQKLKVEEP
ncbi:MAG: hypothetical protein U1E65_00290 [Myxococcota bacterium]